MVHDVETREGIVWVILSGSITMADLQRIGEIAHEIEAGPGPAPHRICDLSAVVAIDLDFTKVEALAAQRRVAPLRNKVKSAIIAPQPALYGFARMFQTLNDNPRIQIKIFPDLPGALHWLKETPPARH